MFKIKKKDSSKNSEQRVLSRNSDSINNNNNQLAVAINNKTGAALNFILKKAPNFIPNVINTAKIITPNLQKKTDKNKSKNADVAAAADISIINKSSSSPVVIHTSSSLLNSPSITPAQKRGSRSLNGDIGNRPDHQRRPSEPTGLDKSTLLSDYSNLSSSINIKDSSSIYGAVPILPSSGKKDTGLYGAVPAINVHHVDITNGLRINRSASISNVPIIKEGYLNKKIDFDYYYGEICYEIDRTVAMRFKKHVCLLIFEDNVIICKRKWVRYTSANLIIDAMGFGDWDTRSISSTRGIPDNDTFSINKGKGYYTKWKLDASYSIHSVDVIPDPNLPMGYSPYIAPSLQPSFNANRNDDTSSLRSVSSNVSAIANVSSTSGVILYLNIVDNGEKDSYRVFVASSNEVRSLWISKLWDAKKANLRKLMKLSDKHSKGQNNDFDQNNGLTTIQNGIRGGGGTNGSQDHTGTVGDEKPDNTTPRRRAFWNTGKHPELIIKEIDVPVIIEQSEQIKEIEVPVIMEQSEQIKEIEVPVVVKQFEEIKEIEVPVVVKQFDQIKEIEVPVVVKQSGQIKETEVPVVLKQSEQIKETEVPVVVKQSDQIKETEVPIVVKQSMEISGQIKETDVPLVMEKSEQIKETDVPLVMEKSEEIDVPLVMEKSEEIDVPLVIEKSEQIKETDVQLVMEKSEQIKETDVPLVIEKSEQIKETDVPLVMEKSEQIKETDVPLVMEKSEQIKETNVPLVMEKSEQIKEIGVPLVMEKSEQIKETNVPVVMEKSEQIKETNVPVVIEKSEQIKETNVPVVMEKSEQIKETNVPVVMEKSEQIKETNVPAVIEQSEQIKETNLPVVMEKSEQIKETNVPAVIEQSEQIKETNVESSSSPVIELKSQALIRGGSIDSLIHELVFETQKGSEENDEFLHSFLLTYPLFAEISHVSRELKRCASIQTRDDIWNAMLDIADDVFEKNPSYLEEIKRLIQSSRDSTLSVDNNEEEITIKGSLYQPVPAPLSLDLSNLLVT
ncbi:9740_t:CDS:2, partial [Scutellospora calospora]